MERTTSKKDSRLLEGLRLHKLPTDKPSQLSDSFQLGYQYALDNLNIDDYINSDRFVSEFKKKHKLSSNFVYQAFKSGLKRNCLDRIINRGLK